MKAHKVINVYFENFFLLDMWFLILYNVIIKTKEKFYHPLCFKGESMTLDTENLINSIMESMERIEFVKSDDLPNIDLYMDQVTTFMERNLGNTTRNKGEDKILTKTMINNYAKNNLLPPPDKKKYSKEHILVLIMIYYFKNILSFNDIQLLLNPLTDRYFDKMPDFSLKDVYDEVAKFEMDHIEDMKKDVYAKYEEASKTFEDREKDQEFLQMFAFICSLLFDVYVKKLLIEKILDEYSAKLEKEKQEAMRKNKAKPSPKRPRKR